MKTKFSFLVLTMTLLYSTAGVTAFSGVVKDSVPGAAGIPRPIHMRQELRSFSLTSEVEINSDETGPIQGSCSLGVCRSDSMALTMYGPFGVLVGKMAASKSSVLYYDALRSQAIQGDPESEKVLAALPFPVSFHDFVHLSRCEVPFESDSYSLVSVQQKDSTCVWAYTGDKRFVDVAKLSLVDGSLLGYQRKTRTGEVLFNMRFENFQYQKGLNFPSSLAMQFPARNAGVTFKVIDFVRDPEGQRYSFRLPKGVTCTRIE